MKRGACDKGQYISENYKLFFTYYCVIDIIVLYLIYSNTITNNN